MSDIAGPAQAPRTYPWLLVLSLVGLDYFSTLAYLPSIAVNAAGTLAPLAALIVTLVTLVAALPVYFYVVGRSPQGEGATGLLEHYLHGWGGKLLILVLLGFVATDFVITRTLSLADASLHIRHNPVWQDHVYKVETNRETIRAALPRFLQGSLFDLLNEQVILTVVLSVLSFGFYTFLQTRMTGAFLRLAGAVVAAYLLLTVVIVVCGLVFLWNEFPLVEEWWAAFQDRLPVPGAGGPLPWAVLVWKAFSLFPAVALGLSGFELSMAVAPRVEGKPDDDPGRPRGRIRNARKILVVSALLMALLVPASTFVVTLLVPTRAIEQGELHGRVKERAEHRALAFLAHGEENTDVVSPLFGQVFGTLYDLSAVLILCFAGASAVLGIRELVPGFLARFGMQLEWARKVGVIVHLFNVVILVVTLLFKADVSHQQGAYATSVLVLLTSAAMAASIDVLARWRNWFGVTMAVPFLLLGLFFLSVTLHMIVVNAAGLAFAFAFISVTMLTSLASRWLRSKELRFHGFEFADEATRRRWDEVRQLEFQVLVPHRPGRTTLVRKEDEVRHKHRLGKDVTILFIEVALGDASEFYHEPLMQIVREESREVIRISRCASIPHVITSIGLEFARVGRPPEIIFGWSGEGPVAATVKFVFLGQGNVPWMVHELIQRAEPDKARQPLVIVG